jgi:hypothetical protein
MNLGSSMQAPKQSISRNFACFVALALCASATWATLGRGPSLAGTSAPSASSASVKAAAAAVTSGLYTPHEVQLTSGTVVTEFADTEGIVFAVTWIGPVLPNLDTLLGNHFSALMNEAQRSRAAGKRGAPINLNSGNLVLTSTGRMGHFSGYAYLPAGIPAGVSIADLLP